MAEAIRELVIKVTVDADSRPLDQVGDASDDAKVKATALGTAIGGLIVKLGEMAIAAAKAGAAMIKDLVFGTAAAGDEIAKTSAKLGVGSDQLQRLRGAAQLSGAEITDLDSGIKDLTKNLGEAIEKGTGPAAEALATLGLEVKDVDEFLQRGDVEGALGLIGDAALALNDPVREQAALMKLMGDAGKNLRPLLETGSQGIRDLGDDVAATGVIISEDGLKQFEAMQDASFLLDQQIQGVKNTIAVTLAPAVSEIADRVRAWVDSNQEFIDQQLPRVMDTLGESLTLVLDVVERVVEALAPAIGALLELAQTTIEKVKPALEDLIESLGPVVDFIGQRLLVAVETLEPAIGVLADSFVFFSDKLTFLIETGNEALDWANSMIKAFEERWPRAFAIAERAVTAITSPIETVRNVAREMFEFIEGLVPQVGEIARILERIRASLGLGEQAMTIQSEGAIVERQFPTSRVPFSTQAARPGSRAAGDLSSAGLAAAGLLAGVGISGLGADGGEEEDGGNGGGGGGRRAPVSTEPTIEDLIGATVAGAGPGVLRSATSALSGTVLSSVDNRIQITVETGAVQAPVTVSAELPSEVGPEASEAIGRVVRAELGSQVREVVEIAQARRNVGP